VDQEFLRPTIPPKEMKIANLGLHDVMERMGDGYSRRQGRVMLGFLQSEGVEDTHDITDGRWEELFRLAVEAAQ
jgi:hypothetical protein